MSKDMQKRTEQSEMSEAELDEITAEGLPDRPGGPVWACPSGVPRAAS